MPNFNHFKLKELFIELVELKHRPQLMVKQVEIFSKYFQLNSER